MIELVVAKGVRKSYGSFVALSDVNFTIGSGVTGLLGPNGSGKTTLFGLILGLHQVDSGTLTVIGEDPRNAGPEVRGRLGYAPEHHTLPPDLPAAEFVRLVAELHGLDKSEAITRASDALWLVGLGEERFRPLGTLSTGQRQKVKLAQALAHDPGLILLDEPTDGLDPVQRDAMLDLIRQISTDFGINVILSSHLLDEVEQICDNAVMIGDGRTLASGSLDELRGTGTTDLMIEVDGSSKQAASLAKVLESGSFDVSVRGRSLTIGGEDDSIFDAARDACVSEGIGIMRLQEGRSSLEDIFLEQMG